MLIHDQTTRKALSLLMLGVSNVSAWVSSVNVGAFATGVTIVGLAAIGLKTQWIERVSSSRAKAWAEEQRLQLQVEQERERVEANSLTGQLKRLMERTEDANKKLHDMRGQLQAQALRHQEEADRLTVQLDLATQQLRDSSDELNSARAEIRALRDEEKRLLSRLAEKQAKQDVKIEENRAAVEQLVNQSGPMPIIKPEETT